MPTASTRSLPNLTNNKCSSDREPFHLSNGCCRSHATPDTGRLFCRLGEHARSLEVAKRKGLAGVDIVGVPVADCAHLEPSQGDADSRNEDC